MEKRKNTYKIIIKDNKGKKLKYKKKQRKLQFNLLKMLIFLIVKSQ
jgi:hypothetical protein